MDKVDNLLEEIKTIKGLKRFYALAKYGSKDAILGDSEQIIWTALSLLENKISEIKEEPVRIESSDLTEYNEDDVEIRQDLD